MNIPSEFWRSKYAVNYLTEIFELLDHFHKEAGDEVFKRHNYCYTADVITILQHASPFQVVRITKAMLSYYDTLPQINNIVQCAFSRCCNLWITTAVKLKNDLLSHNNPSDLEKSTNARNKLFVAEKEVTFPSPFKIDIQAYSNYFGRLQRPLGGQ